MSQSQFSQQSFNLNLPEMNLSDNFFTNFEEISKKYNDINIKTDNILAYENIIKNDSFNDINNIQFHNKDINNKNKKNNKINFDNAELIFDSPEALKINNKEKIIINSDEKNKKIFDEYLKSEYYINRNNKYFYEKNYVNIEGEYAKIEKPNIKEILSKKPWDEDVEFIKENIFNYKHFFPMQKEIINSILMQKNIYVFFPNLNDKLICYQIPAIISNDKTFLIIKSSNDIINKEINIMEELGIKVLNLNLYENINEINLENYFFNRNSEENVKMIYVTPDKIYKNKNISKLILYLYQKEKIKSIVIDEINLMSKWDINFSQDYFELKNIIYELKKCSLICFSNNISSIIRNNIINIINSEKKFLYFKISYNKPNIYFEIKNKTENDEEQVKEILNTIKKNEYENKIGIIYCDTENICEKLYEYLYTQNKIKCGFIHKGLYEKNQKEIIDKFFMNELNIIISNINLNNENIRKDIRFIIYYNIPKNFEIFYEQIKILGLDSEPCKCILYYNNKEINTKKLMLKDINEIRSIEKLIDFCEENNECRRELLLSYFNEEFNKENCYHMCDNCNKNIFKENIDCTKESKNILGILFDKKNKEYDLDELYELYKNENLNNIKKIIRYLIIKEYIDEYFIKDKILLKITNLGENFYKDNINEIKIILPLGNIKQIKTEVNKAYYNNYRRNYNNNLLNNNKKGNLKSEYALENIKDYGLCEPNEFDDLFEQLKNIRRDLLKKENIKKKKNSSDGNFISMDLEDIITNEGLKELVRILPTKEEDFEKNIILKNEKNLKLYKNDIIPTIEKFINIYNIDINKRKENRQNNYSYDINEEKNEKYLLNNDDKDDIFNYKYNLINEEDNKSYNDKNCLFIGIKRKKCDKEKIDKININSASCIFNQLANKSKKNKKAKFL